jgi:RNA polymerase sigma-70 factor (ECF subfamily)
MEPSADELASRARAGDLAAFEDLVRATTNECFALALRLVGNEPDAADVVQDAYLRAFRSIGRFREDASVRTWLYRIVANSAATLRGRRRSPSVSIDEIEFVDPRRDRDPELVAVHNSEREAIVAALGRLPFGLRAVVVLRDIYDLPHDAIAAELGISRSAAKVRLHRARKILGVALDARIDRTSGPRRPKETCPKEIGQEIWEPTAIGDRGGRATDRREGEDRAQAV